VESALKQDGFANYEIVVVDDCSPDHTWDYLRSIESSKLRIFRNNSRLGMGPNWNQAVSLSGGEYIFLLQDDDLALPSLLARASDLLDKYEGVDLICCSTCLIGEDENDRSIFWEPEREELLPAPQALIYFARHWTLSSTQVIFSRATYDTCGGFDETSPIMSDAEAILRWMIYSETLLVPETLALRRSWAGSVTSATQDTQAMVETMTFLVNRVSRTAKASGIFSRSQVNDLRNTLRQTFIKSP
jgi:glycosyltransferase involved in cell wall biosynthesis